MFATGAKVRTCYMYIKSLSIGPNPYEQRAMCNVHTTTCCSWQLFPLASITLKDGAIQTPEFET